MKQFLLSIVSPEREVFAQEVDSVSVPEVGGRIMILPHHTKLFAALSAGVIKILQGGKETLLAIGGGFIDVNTHEVTILVSRAVHAHELNEVEIANAKKTAEELLAKAAKGIERAEALSLLRRSLIELKLFESVRRRHTIS